MIEITRDCILNKYYRLSVKHCPYEILIFAIKLGNEIVTVENYDASAYVDSPKVMNIGLNEKGRTYTAKFKMLKANFEVSRDYFLEMIQGLGNPSFYAVCHSRPFKFTATDLADIPRYRALDNFGWNLEVCSPNNSSEFGFFVSPNKEIIDKVENEVRA